jgi:hypothetical protein
MDLKSMDKEAEIAAVKEIKNMFQRSGQLEKIDQFRHRVSIKILIILFFSICQFCFQDPAKEKL